MAIPSECADTVYGNQFFHDTISVNTTNQATTIASIDTTGKLGRGPCQCVLHARDSISSAQILASHSHPDTLIIAPSLNSTINIISIRYKFVYNSVQYIFSGNAGLIQGDTSQIIESQVEDNYSKNALTQTTNSWGVISVNSNQYITPVGKPIVFRSFSANPTSGDSYLIIYIDYIIEAP